MTTELLDAISPARREVSIERAAALIGGGSLVAFPTETVYGLGADAFDPQAIEAIYRAKGRPSDNPLIVHLASIESMVECAHVDQRALELARRFMPGPLTLVLPSNDRVPMIARGGLDTVAVRIPAHPVALALLALTGPLVAPSANISGRPSPTTALHVASDLDGRIAAILDGGACSVGIESTVVDLSGGSVVILRPGSISREQIEDALGFALHSNSDDSPAARRSPGTRYRHYAPSVPVRLLLVPEIPSAPMPGQRRMILATASCARDFPGEDVRPLDEQTLYRNLRDAEILGVDEVIVHAAADELPAGLLDRVRKAAGV